jgi:alkaline phosphatase D
VREPTTYDRRTFLARAGLTGAAAALVVAGAPRPAAAADEDLAPFLHGVASGDPTASSVVLWTRVTPAGTPPIGPAGGPPVPVRWEIATDLEFRDVVASGTVQALDANDFTVKVVATGLAPFSYHYYRFHALGSTSITGRTKTAPAAGQSVDRLRFGLVSCSNYEGGYFNAYARLAERNDLDAILCAGDYIYEYAPGEYGAGAEIGRVVEPPVEMATLETYRGRFAHYRLDPDLRRAHQLYPWITTWDDHETTNDSWRDGAENHDDGDVPDEDGLDWGERKRRAWKAYREWLPIAVDASSMDEPIVLYRTLAYGDLADLIVMDTRIDDRDEPLFGVGRPGLGSGADDPGRRMISDAQRDHVYGSLSASTASWRLVLQQVMMMQWNAGGLPQGLAGNDFPVLTELGGGNALNGDAWDGYPAERARLFAHLRDGDITDVVVLTGDIHSAWAADLTEDPYDPAVYDPTGQSPLARRNLGVEFVCTSVTSDNIDEIVMEAGAPREAGIAAARAAETATMADNPHIKTVEFEHHGYGIVDVTAERTTYDIWFTPVLEPSPEESHHQSWYVERSGPDVAGHRALRADAPTSTRAEVPPAPPATPEGRPPAAGSPTSTSPGRAVPAAGASPMLPATGGGSGHLLAGVLAAGLGVVVARRGAKPPA